MFSSMYTAISGMSSNGTALSVIGDNISNMNTVGYKGSAVSFGDVLSSSIGGASGSSQIGRGVQVMAVEPLFTQGAFQTTANGLDMAIDGDGLFMVNQGTARYYTRAGQFSLDKDGNITNPDGLVLQGYLADPATGAITGAVGDLQVATRQSPAVITTTATLAVNLDATSTVPGTAFPASPMAAIPADSYNSSTTITVYDSQGGAHPVTAYFVKAAAPNTWTVHYVQNNPLPPPALALLDQGQQTLTFNPDGSLNTVVGGNPTFNFGAGVTSPTVAFGYTDSSQYASDFAVMNLSQDGSSAGSLKSISISDKGVVSGVFTNGQTRPIGQVALGRFIAPGGLTKVGRNLYSESFDSGQPIVGAANSSGFGKVLSSSLELSNVDLAEEFVKMITAQRGFQANSRIVTTTDQLMQELVNLGR